MAKLDVVQTLTRLVSDLGVPSGAIAADVGCGDGQRGARTLADLGYVVHACELDAEKAGLASSFASVDACDARSWRPPEPLDLIVCLELLEHMPLADQRTFLSSMRRWLRPDGTLILSTPQRHSPVALAERLYTLLRRRGTYDWWDPTHVSVLRRKNLEALFLESGFVVKRRLGVHLVPALVPFPVLHWTVHEGLLSALGFDLIYVLKPGPAVARS
ncbi:MAG: methyltransferase domain-containing protein [Acidimicrobiales bacterium]